MIDLDFGECIEVLSDLIIEHGNVVYRLRWDFGEPTSKPNYETVYKFKNKYWAISSFFGLSGPFLNLEDALSDEFVTVGSETEKIYCCEFSVDEIVKKLIVKDLKKSRIIKINNKKLEVLPDGNIRKKLPVRYVKDNVVQLTR